MTQPGLLGNGLWFERTDHRHQLAATTRIIAAHRAKLEYFARGRGKFALPKTLYLGAITGEYLSKYPVKPLMRCATNLTAREASSDRFKRPKACKGGPERERAHRFLFRPRAPYSA